jgi:uncharacterized membrane protein YebE (DUF533 family)
MKPIDVLNKGAAVALGTARSAFDAASPTVKAWLTTGAALGAARTGVRVAGGVIRRNPALAVAAAAVGVGVLAYTAYRKHAQTVAAPSEPGEPIDASATVVETRRRPASPRRKKPTDDAAQTPSGSTRPSSKRRRPAAPRA